MAKGVDFIINVNTGTNELPTWTKVAGQRGGSLGRSADTLDSTSKDSDGWKENEISYKGWEISGEGLLVESDTGYAALEDAFMNDEKVKVQLVTAAGNKYDGLALITDFPLDAPYDDQATYSVTLLGDGALNKVAAS
jgi:TP901-1 family phage major tail protein